MSGFADETVGDAPVRDISLNFAGAGTPGLGYWNLLGGRNYLVYL